MKTRTLITAMALFIIASGVVVYLGCNGEGPCCPEIVEEMKAMPLWICPLCPDSGARLFYKISYQKQTDKGLQPCDPSTKTLELKNLETNKVIQGNFFEKHATIPGVYQNPSGGAFIQVNKTSTIELTAIGEKGCDLKTSTCVVKVVEVGSYHDLCFPYTDPHAGSMQGSWTGNTKIFGFGVVVQSVENINKSRVTINVTHNGVTAMNLAPRTHSNVHNGLPANGQWTLEIPDNAQYQKFINSGEKSLCVRVYITCKCN